MKLIIRITGGLALVAALGLAAPAGAQERSHITHNEETRIVDDNGSRRMEIRSRGTVEFNEAGDWVASVGAGGQLTIEERDGGSERRLEFRPGDGAPRVRYFVNGDERALDASGRAWAQRLVLHAVRESGLGADRRVARIRARSGVNGVLAEIGHIRSDVGRRMYYRALLAGGAMSNGEFARVMEDVGRRMGSDVETRLVLMEAVDRAGDGARVASVLRAAQGIDSDVETRLVLNRVTERHRLADAASRDAFFRAVGGMGSDVERRLVLTGAADERLADGPSREAFFRAVSEFDSDVERRIVLTRILDDASEATSIAAIASAGEMGSDVEKRIVLSQVPASQLRSGRVAAAYRRVAEAMRSDAERRLVMRRLNGNR
ncbi:hypothetical protein [Longimicrobium sp.]|uniref:hypothetical protein n=1 Tax=Longimicrobium sp. TaxID=2029185 RepID=UPI003B3B78F3